MTRTIIDINVLQTVPPSNLNRDDNGSPKTAVYGGTRRARVSSQAWKRATRLGFKTRLNPSELGVRTKRVVELLAERIHEKNSGIEKEAALDLAKKTLESAGVKLSPPRVAKGQTAGPDESGFLLFLSSLQVDHLAGAALEAAASDDFAATLKSLELKKKLDLNHSVDIALFGRMVADATDLNVDAASQVAHALSVHEVDNEFDYYTAVDDHKAADDAADAGAGMIGTVEFNSSTLYRYATVDANRLMDNLGDVEATKRAVEAFVDSFVTSMPTGKQNTFGNRTLPDAVIVTVRSTQPVNLVGAFEEPVSAPHLKNAAAKLAKYVGDLSEAYGSLVAPDRVWVARVSDSLQSLDALGPRVPLSELVTQLGSVVEEQLKAQP
ncbi:type I-E CRISPR-associated protein Cas7/Cse4/CasC [Psychromicrobium xiongbiense]|uniref:type I-E CRISPR-associated protein Cas7/Cse4/CasC n=1 Tax=Psychromicrobium xiongbiense TaxID=3051184 RepID=UPI002555A390|nr:type I-E CRISPR-associated protein Cas7/Cse4/CasC [Psychromicrobium sp. YIM S02556]